MDGKLAIRAHRQTQFAKAGTAQPGSPRLAMHTGGPTPPYPHPASTTRDGATVIEVPAAMRGRPAPLETPARAHQMQGCTTATTPDQNIKVGLAIARMVDQDGGRCIHDISLLLTVGHLASPPPGAPITRSAL